MGLRRRAFLSLAPVAAGMPLLRAVPARADGDAFTFSGGIGRRTGGPSLHDLKPGTSGFARADRRTWWTPAGSVDGFSRLDEIFPGPGGQAPEAYAW